MLQDKEIPVLDEDRLSEDPAAAGAGAAESGSLKSQLAGLVEDVGVHRLSEHLVAVDVEVQGVDGDHALPVPEVPEDLGQTRGLNDGCIV